MEWYDLNNRHIASVLWLIILVATGAFNKNIRQSAIGLIGAALERRVLSLLIEMLFYCAVVLACVVVLGKWLGLWNTLPLVAAIFWFGLSGISLIGLIFSSKPGIYWKKVRDTLGLPAIAIALLDVSVFSFLFEFLLFIPLSTLLTCMLVVAQTKNDTHQGVKILLSILSLSFHISVIVFSLVTGKITLVSVIQAFILPTALTVGVFPYLWYVRFIERFHISSRSVRCRKITSTEFGDGWPFTVDTLRLCYVAGAIWVEKWKVFPLPHKKRYPVNGIAPGWLATRGYKYGDLSEIWRQLPDGSRVNIYYIIQKGLAMGQMTRS